MRSSRAAGLRAAPGFPRNAEYENTDGPEVSRTLADGRPYHGARMVVFVAPGRGSVGFVAGRRVGGAVARNRARRILRAAWRQLGSRVQGGKDYALVARVSIRGAKTQDLVVEMEELLRRAQAIVR